MSLKQKTFNWMKNNPLKSAMIIFLIVLFSLLDSETPKAETNNVVQEKIITQENSEAEEVKLEKEEVSQKEKEIVLESKEEVKELVDLESLFVLNIDEIRKKLGGEFLKENLERENESKGYSFDSSNDNFYLGDMQISVFYDLNNREIEYFGLTTTEDAFDNKTAERFIAQAGLDKKSSKYTIKKVKWLVDSSKYTTVMVTPN